MQDRELERELRELGALIDYPPTPDVAHAARSLLDEEEDGRPQGFRGLSKMRWAAAAAFMLLVAVPYPLPQVACHRQRLVRGGGHPARRWARCRCWLIRETVRNERTPLAASKSGTSPALAPRLPGKPDSLREARATMDGALLMPEKLGLELMRSTRAGPPVREALCSSTGKGFRH